MKSLRDYIKERQDKLIEKWVVSRYRVRSRSDPREFHLVELLKDGKLACDCLAGYYGSDSCHHKKVIRKYLDKKLGGE